MKPCPFCGNTKIEHNEAMGEWWIYCRECGASTEMSCDKNKAEKAWNRRIKPERKRMV